jgi:hypothetical protein
MIGTGQGILISGVLAEMGEAKLCSASKPFFLQTSWHNSIVSTSTPEVVCDLAQHHLEERRDNANPTA